MRKINIVSVDLGTKNLIIKINGQIVYDQPSFIVFDNESGQIFIGDEALIMSDTLPDTRVFKEPLVNGVISDINALIALLTEIFVNIVQVHNKKIWKKQGFWTNSVVLIGIPSKICRLDEDILIETFQGKHVARIPIFSEKFKRYDFFSSVMNAEKVIIVPHVKLAAIGAGLSIWDSEGVFLLDIGAGTSDCSILASGDVIIQDSIPFAGNFIDNEIKKYFEEMHYLAVSRRQAEEIKFQVGLPNEEFEAVSDIQDMDNNITIYGKSLKTGAPERLIIEKSKVEQLIAQAFEPVVELCKGIILRSSESFAKTIQSNGLVLTGGGALLKNVGPYLLKRLNLENVFIADDPLKCVIKGTEIYEMHKHDLYDKGFIRPSK
ncbi:MAG: rod shape-determining protein [Spiroplasma sp.]